MSDEESLIGMREGSCKYQRISSIEKPRILRVLFSDVVYHEYEDEDECQDL
jgi:hypothetical protein